MHAFLAALVFAAQSAAPPPPAPAVPLTIAQQSALRCSVAIAIAAEQQRAGQASGNDWPDLTIRGREFFVRSLAKLMDEAQLTRPMLADHAQREAELLDEPARLTDVMPACLLLLEASGL